MSYVENSTKHQQLMIMPAKQQLRIMPARQQLMIMSAEWNKKNVHLLHCEDDDLLRFKQRTTFFGQRTRGSARGVKYYAPTDTKYHSPSIDDNVNHYLTTTHTSFKNGVVGSIQQLSYSGDRTGADYFLNAPPAVMNMNLRGWDYFNKTVGMCTSVFY